KLKQESVLQLRTWLRHEFANSDMTLNDRTQVENNDNIQ
ncbi:MAG: LysR family transcriptional regulator, partial [Pseudomonadota bacterium]|nr:LysR family transcriptional regulator [Pseudomonadota bacterium]